MIINGKTNCGKTEFVLDLIETEYGDFFDRIVIFCPTFEYNSAYRRNWILKSDNVSIRNGVIPIDQDLPYMTGICKDKGNVLFLIDDHANSRYSHKKGTALSNLAFSGRHLKISVWFITQKYNAVVKDFRENTQMVVTFFDSNESSRKAFFEENSIVPKEERNKLVQILKDNQYSKLVIRTKFPFQYSIIYGAHRRRVDTH